MYEPNNVPLTDSIKEEINKITEWVVSIYLIKYF